MKTYQYSPRNFIGRSIFIILVIFMIGPMMPLAQNSWAKTYGGAGHEVASFILQTSDQGYIVAGTTAVSYSNVWIFKIDSNGNIQWQKEYGFARVNDIYSIQQTSDGGYIVGGSVDMGNTGEDALILKLNSSGEVSWQKTFGGNLDDLFYSVQQTSEGSYIATGFTKSFGQGRKDIWVLKLAASGDIAWQKTFGSTVDEEAYSTHQTEDGGYIIGGTAMVAGSGQDALVIKMDALGNVQWQKAYSQTETSVDYLRSIKQTSDGGFICSYYSNPQSSLGIHFGIIKLDMAGNVVWGKTYGGTYDDEAYYVSQTEDGGYIAIGSTFSFDSYPRLDDVWVIRLDPNGNIVWEKAFGDMDVNPDKGMCIQQTLDGGYIGCGYSGALGIGGEDALVFKMDNAGNISSHCSLLRDTYASTHVCSIVVQNTAFTSQSKPVSAGHPNLTATTTAADITNICTGNSCPSISILPSSLSNGAVGMNYSHTITANGGQAPYSFSIVAGALPPDLTLSSNGILSGVPRVEGTYNFTVMATDLYSCVASSTYSLIVTLNAACTVTCTTTVQAEGFVGELIPFHANASPSNCSGVLSYYWDFGDGETATGADPQYSYANVGTYNWSVTASVDGQECSKSGTITISASSVPVIYSVWKGTNPFRLIINGGNYLNQTSAWAWVYINGVAVPQTSYKGPSKIVAKGGNALKAMVPKGVTVQITVKNPDGTYSEPYSFIR